LNPAQEHLGKPQLLLGLWAQLHVLSSDFASRGHGAIVFNWLRVYQRDVRAIVVTAAYSCNAGQHVDHTVLAGPFSVCEYFGGMATCEAVTVS